MDFPLGSVPLAYDSFLALGATRLGRLLRILSFLVECKRTMAEGDARADSWGAGRLGSGAGGVLQLDGHEGGRARQVVCECSCVVCDG